MARVVPRHDQRRDIAGQHVLGLRPRRGVAVEQPRRLRDDVVDGTRKLLAHELVHVRQYHELGMVRFLARYLRDYLSANGVLSVNVFTRHLTDVIRNVTEQASARLHP